MKFEDLPQKKQTELIQSWKPLVDKVSYASARKYRGRELDELKHFATIGLWNAFQTVELDKIINLDGKTIVEPGNLKEEHWDVLINGEDAGKTKFLVFAKLRMNGFIIDQVRQESEQRREFFSEYKEMIKVKKNLVSSGIDRPTHKQIGDVLNKKQEYVVNLFNERVTYISNDERKPEVHESTDHSKSAGIYDTILDDGDTPDVKVNKIQSLKFVDKFIETLNEKEKYIFENYYFNEMKLKEMGVNLGINESRASQILTAVFKKIETYMDNIHNGINGHCSIAKSISDVKSNISSMRNLELESENEQDIRNKINKRI